MAQHMTKPGRLKQSHVEASHVQPGAAPTEPRAPSPTSAETTDADASGQPGLQTESKPQGDSLNVIAECAQAGAEGHPVLSILTILVQMLPPKLRIPLLIVILITPLFSAIAVAARYAYTHNLVPQHDFQLYYSQLTGGAQISIMYTPDMTPNELLAVCDIDVNKQDLAALGGSYSCTHNARGLLTGIDICLPPRYLRQFAGGSIEIDVRFTPEETWSGVLPLPKRLDVEVTGAQPLPLQEHLTRSTDVGLGKNRDLLGRMIDHLRSYEGYLGSPSTAYVCGPDTVTMTVALDRKRSTHSNPRFTATVSSVRSNRPLPEYQLLPATSGTTISASINLATELRYPGVYWLRFYEGQVIRDEILLVRRWEPLREVTNGAQWALAPEDYGEWEMPQAGERGAVRARRSGVEQTGGSEQQYYAINFDDLENRALKPSVGTYIFSLEFSDSSHGCVSLACFDVTATFPWGVGMNAPSITFAAELKRRFLARDDPAQWATSIGGTWVRTEDQERDPALRFYAWTGSKHLFDGAAHTVSASLRVNAGLNANGEEWYTLSLYQDGRLLGNAFDLEAQNALSRFQPTIRHFGCLYLVVYHYYAYFLPEISSPI